MKLDKISQNKLKVTLTSDDVKKWGIKFDHFAYNTPEVQELFWSVMKQAELELGFFADGKQLFVEAISTRTDGFVLMVTKLDNKDSIPQKTTQISAPSSAAVSNIASGLPAMPARKASCLAPVIFSFTDFDNAITACKEIGSSFTGQSTLYKYQEKYYLSLEVDATSIEHLSKSNLLEYGTDTYQPALFQGRLSEHGEVLIENNAVETFCTYF